MTKPWLTGLTLTGTPGRWDIDKSPYVIGRKEPADLVLPVPRISRRHVAITREKYGCYLTDLGSTNGTFVNGELLGPEPHRLVGGDELVLGGVVTFKFHDPEETMAGPRVGRLAGVWIDPDTSDVWVDALPVEPPLSPAQFTLLQLLYENAGTIIPRDDIIHTVWADVDPEGVSGEAVDGLIKRLRQRLRAAQPDNEYLQVVRGHGLRLIHP